MKILIGGLAALLAATALSACGKMGDLERPGPLAGKGKAASAAGEQPQGARPMETVDPRDRTSDPSPPRTAPITSSGSDPFSQPPQGALPNPYARPQ